MDLPQVRGETEFLRQTGKANKNMEQNIPRQQTKFYQ